MKNFKMIKKFNQFINESKSLQITTEELNKKFGKYFDVPIIDTFEDKDSKIKYKLDNSEKLRQTNFLENLESDKKLSFLDKITMATDSGLLRRNNNDPLNSYNNSEELLTKIFKTPLNDFRLKNKEKLYGISSIKTKTFAKLQKILSECKNFLEFLDDIDERKQYELYSNEYTDNKNKNIIADTFSVSYKEIEKALWYYILDNDRDY